MYKYDEIIDRCIDGFSRLRVIEADDIPNIDLYMDQVTTFMEQALSSYKRDSKDKILTKTMINNYTKAKIFPPPVKKKYSRSHLMLLIMLYHLKSVLSIHDIGALLKPITDELNTKGSSPLLEETYVNFVKLQKSTISYMISSLQATNTDTFLQKDMISSYEDDTMKKILLVLLFSLQANTEKRLAEGILDHFF